MYGLDQALNYLGKLKSPIVVLLVRMLSLIGIFPCLGLFWQGALQKR